MFNAQVAGYTGKQLASGFVGFQATENCFLLLAIEEGTSEAEGQKLLENLHEQLVHAAVASLSTFENTLNSQIFKQNLPAHFSLAAGVLHENTLFVKTVGNGQIYFRRGRDFALLISGDKSATGALQEYDCAVFTTTAIQQILGDAVDIQAFIDMNAPGDIVDKLQNEEYDEEERGFSVIFAEFMNQPVASAPAKAGINPFADPITEKNPVRAAVADTPPAEVSEPRAGPRFHFGGSKKIALILSIVLFGILLWSVVFGYERRAAARFEKKVEETGSSIASKLDKAQEEAFLNMDISLELISQAKEELNDIKTESEGRNTEEIAAIEKRIQEAESGIVKKEEKENTEFYDLALEDKNAKAATLGREGDTVAILDPTNKMVYTLSLDKKSIDKYTATEVADATLVALYDETIYFFSPKKGIFRFTTSNKVKNVVKPDTDWGMIVDFQIFSGNLYLLDKTSNEIYKYVPTEDGYSDKSSYITSGSVDLSDATGMTIDASIYVSTGSGVYKFTRGASEEFKTEYPDQQVALNGVYTDAEIEQVYTWDNAKSVIYVLEKDGGYIRQLQSSVLTKAARVFIYEGAAYILAGSKIYTITLD